MMRLDDYSSIRVTCLAVGFAIFFVMHSLCCDVFWMLMLLVMMIIICDALTVREIISKKNVKRLLFWSKNMYFLYLLSETLNYQDEIYSYFWHLPCQNDSCETVLE